VGRRANTPVHPVSVQAMLPEIASIPEREDHALAQEASFSQPEFPTQPSHLPAFMLGTVIGALAGAALGTLVSPHTRAYLVGLYQLVSRRLSSAERDKLRFELLLQ
jgi:hypothetical protein